MQKYVDSSAAVVGIVNQCSLSVTRPNYNYHEIVQKLQGSPFHFKVLGEGGFGVILGSEECAIKVIKDVARCQELDRERQIYEAIEPHRVRPICEKHPQIWYLNGKPVSV